MSGEMTAMGPGEDLGDMVEESPRTPRRREVSFSRRKELLAFAVDIAEQIVKRVQPHERCILRHMVEGLMER